MAMYQERCLVNGVLQERVTGLDLLSQWQTRLRTGGRRVFLYVSAYAKFAALGYANFCTMEMNSSYCTWVCTTADYFKHSIHSIVLLSFTNCPHVYYSTPQSPFHQNSRPLSWPLHQSVRHPIPFPSCKSSNCPQHCQFCVRWKQCASAGCCDLLFHDELELICLKVCIWFWYNIERIS